MEHIYKEKLPGLIESIFGKSKPKVIIMTTPNADFNKYFPNFGPNFTRHDDHKFEWTEREFRTWLELIIFSCDFIILILFS